MLYENETVTMNRGDYTTCTINLHGATITSWRFEDEEQLFVSRLSRFCGLFQVRGGIAFVFPVFGPWFFGPRHGFARNQKWNLDQGPTINEDLDVYAKFSLNSSAYTEAMWNYDFRLLYTITLCEKKIDVEMAVENLSKHFPFEFGILQHVLLKVPDVEKCEMIGFKDHLYRDQIQGGEELMVEDREEVTVSEWTDRIYHNITHPILLTHTMKDLKLEIGRERTQDINLWNPWEEVSEHLQDLDNDEHKYFIAIEPGVIKTKRRLRLEPMSCWQARTTWKVIEPKIERLGHFYDLFDGYC